ARTVPVRGADPPRRAAQPGRTGRLRRGTSGRRRPAVDRGRRPGTGGEPARRHRGAGQGGRDHPAGHAVRAVPLGRRGAGQLGDAGRAGSDVADARVQGMRRPAGARMTARRVLIVGYGMAGARLVSELHARDPRLDVTVLGAEPHRADNRILLSALVAGKAREPEVTLTEPAGHGVHLRLGTEAVAVDPVTRTVSTSDGDDVPYDRLVLATGSRALLPPIKGRTGDDGSLPDRVAVFRPLDDCRRILGLATGARQALVLGGGLLGLEAARGLAARGLDVTVLHAVGHLMERQLDPAASAVLV